MKVKFISDFIQQFTANTNLSEDDILRFLSKQLICGGSDRASKILKFAELLSGSADSYIHFPCDNHVTETAWESVQKLRLVEMVEEV